MNYKLPLLIGLGVFGLCLSIIFITEKDQMNQMVILVSGIYGIVCFSFLLFQLYAFIKVHLDYDEKVEEVKYDVFKAEGIDDYEKI